MYFNPIDPTIRVELNGRLVSAFKSNSFTPYKQLEIPEDDDKTLSIITKLFEKKVYLDIKGYPKTDQGLYFHNAIGCLTRTQDLDFFRSLGYDIDSNTRIHVLHKDDDPFNFLPSNLINGPEELNQLCKKSSPEEPSKQKNRRVEITIRNKSYLSRTVYDYNDFLLGKDVLKLVLCPDEARSFLFNYGTNRPQVYEHLYLKGIEFMISLIDLFPYKLLKTGSRATPKTFTIHDNLHEWPMEWQRYTSEVLQLEHQYDPVTDALLQYHGILGKKFYTMVNRQDLDSIFTETSTFCVNHGHVQVGNKGLHQVVMPNCPQNMVVAHFYDNGFDNRRCVLRYATATENSMDRERNKIWKETIKFTSEVTVKSYEPRELNGLWMVEVPLNWNNIVVGYFLLQEDAVKVLNYVMDKKKLWESKEKDDNGYTRRQLNHLAYTNYQELNLKHPPPKLEGVTINKAKSYRVDLNFKADQKNHVLPLFSTQNKVFAYWIATGIAYLRKQFRYFEERTYEDVFEEAMAWVDAEFEVFTLLEETIGLPGKEMIKTWIQAVDRQKNVNSSTLGEELPLYVMVGKQLTPPKCSTNNGKWNSEFCCMDHRYHISREEQQIDAQTISTYFWKNTYAMYKREFYEPGFISSYMNNVSYRYGDEFDVIHPKSMLIGPKLKRSGGAINYKTSFSPAVTGYNQELVFYKSQDEQLSHIIGANVNWLFSIGYFQGMELDEVKHWIEIWSNDDYKLLELMGIHSTTKVDMWLHYSKSGQRFPDTSKDEISEQKVGCFPCSITNPQKTALRELSRIGDVLAFKIWSCCSLMDLTEDEDSRSLLLETVQNLVNIRRSLVEYIEPFLTRTADSRKVKQLITMDIEVMKSFTKELAFLVAEIGGQLPNLEHLNPLLQLDRIMERIEEAKEVKNKKKDDNANVLKTQIQARLQAHDDLKSKTDINNKPTQNSTRTPPLTIKMSSSLEDNVLTDTEPTTHTPHLEPMSLSVEESFTSQGFLKRIIQSSDGEDVTVARHSRMDQASQARKKKRVSYQKTKLVLSSEDELEKGETLELDSDLERFT